jgi:hypothetical protein
MQNVKQSRVDEPQTAARYAVSYERNNPEEDLKKSKSEFRVRVTMETSRNMHPTDYKDTPVWAATAHFTGQVSGIIPEHGMPSGSMHRRLNNSR